METFLNLILTPIGLGLSCFILIITLISGWLLHAYIGIRKGEGEYLTEKMKKKYYDEFMFKIGGKETVVEEKYGIYLIKILGKSILLTIICAFYVVLALALAIVIGKYYLWIGLVVGFVYWMVRKIVKKYKRKKLSFA